MVSDIRSRELLGWTGILPMLRQACISEAGCARLLGEAQQPDSWPANPEDLARLHAEVRAWALLLDHAAPSLPADLADIDPVLNRVEPQGAVLDPEELHEIARILEAAEILSEAAVQDAEEADPPELPDLLQRLRSLPTESALLREIRRVILPDARINEDLPELRRIRRQIADSERDIRSHANRMLRDPQTRELFTGDEPTQRNGRLVLPVAITRQSQVPGIHHGTSNSGQTVFVEPQPVVELNNRIVDLEGEWQQEILRLLRACSSAVRDSLAALRELTACLTYEDLRIARARLGLSKAWNPASAGEDFRLLGARNPELGARAVPVDLDFPDGVRVLVISGPNAGGKTAAAKTMGLLTLMHHFGLWVPAEPDSVLPWTSVVEADIGDEQSLSESLSTFSGHMLRVRSLLKRAGSESLVILDELASGTDYEEGAALGMAICRALRDAGARAVITTHYAQLKHFALEQEGMANAAVSLDPDSGDPDFRLRTGLPGVSQAIAAARRVGMQESVLADAEAALGEGQTNIAAILVKLEEHRSQLESEAAELSRERGRIARLERNLQERERELRERELQVRDSDLRDHQRFLRDARSRLEAVVREIREQGTDATTDDAAKLRAELEQELNQRQASRDSLAAQAGSHQQDAAFNGLPGTRVRYLPNGATGTILGPAKRGRFAVQIGAVRMEVPGENLEVLQSATGPSRPERPVVPDSGARTELDIRGYRVAEGLDELDGFLDAALAAGLTQVSILHGTGTGALQQAVRQHLSRHPLVATASFARPEFGGFGKTLVQLRR